MCEILQNRLPSSCKWLDPMWDAHSVYNPLEINTFACFCIWQHLPSKSRVFVSTCISSSQTHVLSVSTWLSLEIFYLDRVLEMFCEQCGFKMKPSTSFWSIWDSMCACATLLNRWAKFKHSSRMESGFTVLLWDTHIFEFSTSRAHGEVRRGKPMIFLRPTPSVALATLGGLSYFQ